MTTITFTEKSKSILTRRDLKPGTVFAYSRNGSLIPQLLLVPDPAFSRYPGITEKDIVIDGCHSGTLDDWRPTCAVVVINLTATPAEASFTTPLQEAV